MFPAEGNDFGERRRAAGVGDVTLVRGVDDISAAPEVVKRVVDGNRTDAELVGELHGGFHRFEGDRLAELFVRIPALNGFVLAGEFLDRCTGDTTPGFGPEQLVEMERLQRVMRLDSVSRGKFTESRRCFAFRFVVAAFR